MFNVKTKVKPNNTPLTPLLLKDREQFVSISPKCVSCFYCFHCGKEIRHTHFTTSTENGLKLFVVSILIQLTHFFKLTIGAYVPQISSCDNSMVYSTYNISDSQKPTHEQLKQWANFLRSDASILEKFVSSYTELFYCH